MQQEQKMWLSPKEEALKAEEQGPPRHPQSLKQTKEQIREARYER